MKKGGNIMKKSWWLIAILALVVLAIFIWPRNGDVPDPGDNGENGNNGENGQNGEVLEELELGYVNWACATATGYLAKNIFESELDMDVNLRDMQAGLMWQSLGTGDIDMILSAWLPLTHGQYYDEVEEDVELVRENYEGARIGLVVPEYVDIDSIEELNDHVDEFGGQIVGIDAGAGIMNATQEALEVYDLDYSLLESGDAAMTAELSTAIENEEWIVITGWTPHWKFAQFDLKFLEDPQDVYGGEETINSVTREGFADDFPWVQSFLENFYMTDEQLGGLIGLMEEVGDNDQAAQQWIEENRELVDEWLAE